MAAFPLDLTLRTSSEGLRLYAEFIPELSKLRNEGTKQDNIVVKSGKSLKVGDISQPMEIIAEFDPGKASKITFTGPELDISWSTASKEVSVTEVGKPEAETYGYASDGKIARLNPRNGRMTLHILLDISSVEVTTSDGDYIIKGRDYRKLVDKSPMEIHSEGGDVKFSRLEVYSLKSIHNDESRKGLMKN